MGYYDHIQSELFRMRPKIDLTGQIFEKLTVLEEAEKKYTNNETLWKCRCLCGNITRVPGSCLRQKLRKSCGCIWKPHSQEFLISLKIKLEKNCRWNGQCQEWTGQKNRKGYGRMYITDKTMHDVHKISWLLHVSRVPKGYIVMQKCGNLSCFRPEHLELLKKG